MRWAPSGPGAAVLVLALLLGGLTACGDDAGAPGPSNVDVDTPALREAKAAAGIAPCEPGPGGGGLPSLTLACLGGGPDVDLASLRGPLVVNLWSSSCGPCKKEMPALQQFHETYGDQVPLVGIDITDTYPAAAIGLAELTGATYPQLADPGGELFDLDELRLRPSLPQFILLDADGGVQPVSKGGLTSLDEVVEMVETTLRVSL